MVGKRDAALLGIRMLNRMLDGLEDVCVTIVAKP